MTNAVARLNFRMDPSLKKIIQETATVTGQTVSDFAISALTRAARQVVEERDVTELSNRDRDLFLALLDDTHRKPNKALKEAASRYRKQIGKKSKS
jgi:uncharacterized protein (DUF1778 family)